ncbi:MAG TPA: DUF3108 domain-containing protein [Candidatus Tectomicrobia bacterium]|nr:DUF3108 domain-containing protein [Candidatus Tectomicrobia bacterium]
MVATGQIDLEPWDERGVYRALIRHTRQVSYFGYSLIFLLSLTPATAFATDSPSPPAVASLKSESRAVTVPFFVGEELVFELRWMGLLAGNASLAVSSQVVRNGHEVYRIRSLAESSPFFSLFYYVRDMGETFVDARELYPWHFQLDQREGSRVIQRTVAFDQRRGIAIYTKNQESPQEVQVPVGVHDSLSSFYRLRTLPLRVGHSMHLKTFSNGKTYDVEVQILRREKVEAYWGAVEALVVRPLMRFQEILRQKGEVLIWVTDDDRRLPVRMTTAIKVGSIEATLIDVKRLQ